MFYDAEIKNDVESIESESIIDKQLWLNRLTQFKPVVNKVLLPSNLLLFLEF